MWGRQPRGLLDSTPDDPIAAAAGADGERLDLGRRPKPESGRPVTPQVGHADSKAHRQDGNRRRRDDLSRRRRYATRFVFGDPKDSILEANRWAVIGALLEVSTKARLERIFVNHGTAPVGEMR